MSPDPIVRGQAVIFVVLSMATILLGDDVGGLVCAGVVGLVGFLLWLRYRGDVRRAGERADTRPQRARLDVFVAGDLRLVVGVAIAVGVIVLIYRNGAPSGVGTIRSVLFAIAVVWSVVYMSSLVDWYIVLPRVSGQLGSRPCRLVEVDAASDRYPKSWRETTRIWYLHRLATALVVRFGLSYAATLALTGLIPFPLGTRLAVVAGLGVLNAYGPFALLPVGREVIHVRIRLGQAVRRVQTEHLAGWRLGPLFVGMRAPDKTTEALKLGEREYVYDVAAEGIDLAAIQGRELPDGAARRGSALHAQTNDFERHPTRVSAQRIEYLEPCGRDEFFTGCTNGRCSGINWYCVENPEAFDQK